MVPPEITREPYALNCVELINFRPNDVEFSQFRRIGFCAAQFSVNCPGESKTAVNRGSRGSMLPDSCDFARQLSDSRSAKGVRMLGLEEFGPFLAEEFGNWIMSFQRR